MKFPLFKRRNSIRTICFTCFLLALFSNIIFLGYFFLAGYKTEGSTVKVATCPLVTGGECPDPRVRFYLYSPLNPTRPELIEYTTDSSNLLQLGFNTSLPTKILSHGYNSGRFIFDNLRRGLDPAMPLFVTNNLDAKLDASDAEFVDVVHTNGFAQGKVEQCGHIDFYMNGGVTQPGCYGDSGCNHHRALAYFEESVRSERGFWGWPCGGLMHYVLGLCPPRGTARRMGEDVDRRGQGFYVARTNAEAPFARGPWQVAPTEFTRTGLRSRRAARLLRGR